MKKGIAVFLSTFMLFSATAFAACKNDESETNDTQNEQTETSKSGYLTLNTYSVTLKVGETLQLDVKKYDGNDEEQTITEIEYTSELESVANVANGLITAVSAGETYVNVMADGLETSVFVKVQTDAVTDGLAIRFSSQKLYVGVPIQAHAFILEGGVTVAEPTDVVWSVGDAETLEITQTGLVTPKTVTDSATVKANCSYGGKSYQAEWTGVVVEPTYYAFSQARVKLADDKTVSGSVNDLYTAIDIRVKRVNAVNGEKTDLDKSQFSVTVGNDTLAQASVADDGTVTLQALTVGETTLQAKIQATGETVAIPLEVTTPIATIADMDTLSLSTYNDTSLLSGNYMLVGDIDYDGDVIMPISSYTGSAVATDMTAGIQWKYRLKATENGYEMEDRTKFGKAGTGLTDEEFAKFNDKHTAKGTFNLPFTGTIDGNGYSVKNAEIFYGAWVSVSKADNYVSNYTGIFGVFNGTLKNISFENITMQDPHNYMGLELSEYGIDRVYTLDGKIIDGALRKDPLNAWTPEPRFYKAGSYSLICKGENCTLENVYYELAKGLGKASQGSTGMMVSWAVGQVTVKNCVLHVADTSQATRYAMCGTGSDALGTFANNLVLGMKSFHTKIDDLGVDTLGFNGNWWLGDTKTAYEWRDLFNLEAGALATNVRSVQETAATFDTGVWDMSGFKASKNGRPIMIKGCSVLLQEKDDGNDGNDDIVTEEYQDDKQDILLGADKEWGNID
ncbi:MAG: hypothetical protein E7357_03575 [Clostridiales bacterium]|nr:hypothetical protein [Clostridiales bacterium]